MFVFNFGFAQTKFVVMELNVENLFDTQHDIDKEDLEFLPTSDRRWTRNRYHIKLQRIAKTIAAASFEQPVDLVALCEVENDSALSDLTRYHLWAMDYKYVMTNSLDARGIDVALLYQENRFRLIEKVCYRLKLQRKKEQVFSRDILHVVGRIITGDTLDVFVCHFPSRRGGEKQSSPLRNQAALQLKERVDSILLLRKKPNVILLGDFNDTPSNPSILKYLNAKPTDRIIEKDKIENSLVNLTPKKGSNPQVKGTYKFMGEWFSFDQIIVNASLLDVHRSFYTLSTSAQILDKYFLLTDDDRNFGVTPFSTYFGLHYLGGFSDHLPLTITFFCK
ncbi:MAG: endonuclease [Bacteroidaceae bacterium]